MPNWTTNTLRVTGDAKELDEMEALMSGDDSPFDFNRLIPCPQELLDTQEVHYPKDSPQYAERERERARLKKKYGFTGWYDWCIAKWGTKWSASSVSSEREGGVVTYEFETAWAPPTPVIMTLSKRFPGLTFVHEAHEEGGLWPSFEAVIVDGVVKSEEKIKSIHESDEDA